MTSKALSDPFFLHNGNFETGTDFAMFAQTRSQSFPVGVFIDFCSGRGDGTSEGSGREGNDSVCVSMTGYESDV